ncbi:MAG: lysophospholipase, partial [Thermanaerothrix sp.]|nr:lysophospholipase [Thermanaerothrix sp.]
PHISLRLGVGLILAGEWLLNFKGEFPLPLLLMQGTDDRLVDPGATDQFARQISGDITYKTWEGFYHELHNEPQKDAVIAFILDWIETLIAT